MQITKHLFFQSESSLLQKWFTWRKIAFVITILLLIASIASKAGHSVETKRQYQMMLTNTPTPIKSARPFSTSLVTPLLSIFPTSEQIPQMQSTKDLPLIAEVVMEWVLKQPSSYYPHPAISFLTNDGIYATGGLSDLDSAGGVNWFAAKLHGQWIIVYVGQDAPRCSEVKQYRLPEIALKHWLKCSTPRSIGHLALLYHPSSDLGHGRSYNYTI
jgi:hypothetical protein